MPEDRLYPARPILAVSAAVFREGRVLIARRARPPLQGAYSLPGGVVEVGETLAEAAARELFEEVGVEADNGHFVELVQPIAREGERVRMHFVIIVFAAHWRRGEPRLSVEVDAVEWVDPFALGEIVTTPELPRILARAAASIELFP